MQIGEAIQILEKAPNRELVIFRGYTIDELLKVFKRVKNYCEIREIYNGFGKMLEDEIEIIRRAS